jgi:hypothetical protein
MKNPTFIASTAKSGRPKKKVKQKKREEETPYVPYDQRAACADFHNFPH